MSIKIQKLGISLICALLIVLFIYTGLNKMLDYSEFRYQLGRSPFVEKIAGIISLTMPVGELLVAAALIFSKTRMLGLYASFFLMTLFTGYIWIMLKYSFDLPCTCGGILEKMSWEEHLVFNAVFSVLTGIGVLLQSKRLRSDRQSFLN